MPRKKAAPTPALIPEPKRPRSRLCEDGKPPGAVPLRRYHCAGTAYARGRWYQLLEAGIVPPKMAEPTDRRCNYAFQDNRDRLVKVMPYGRHMWSLSWPEERASVEPKASEPLASVAVVPGVTLNGMPIPGRKMLWFKDRSVWTHEMHVAELEERIRSGEEDNYPEYTAYWKKQLNEYLASLKA